MKKFIAVLLVATLCFGALPAYAADTDKWIEPADSKYEVLWNVSTDLRISGSTATCDAIARTNRAGYKVTATMRLQKKVGASWTNVASWTSSSTSPSGVSMLKTKSSLSSGTYRTHLAVSVYQNGNYVEYASRTSSERRVY